MIHEEICTYEVCMLAKEKGFYGPTAKITDTRMVQPVMLPARVYCKGGCERREILILQ